jgi:hypothetical protein
MGMYDTLKIKTQLPLPEEVKGLDIDWGKVEYQTKDLDNCLSEYIISENGKLIEVIIEREYVYWTDEEKKTAPKWSLFKDVIEKSREEKELNHHGVIRFYCFERFDDSNDFFIDYDAYFTYGKLDKIEVAEFKKFEVKRDQLDSLFAEHKKFKNRAKRFVAKYSGWNWFWLTSTKALHKLSSCIEKVRVFIYRFLIV